MSGLQPSKRFILQYTKILGDIYVGEGLGVALPRKESEGRKEQSGLLLNINTSLISKKNIC